ncbi:kinase-like domain-containing protein, partial [Gigaspora rosea]
EKLNLLNCIASDLEAIHSQGLLHRDLHSGNVLQDELDNACISDLGSETLALKEKSQFIYGILQCIAPEVLNGEQYTRASDIYSFGIIMWEILYGASYILEPEPQLNMEICYKNLRPTIIKNSPQCYVSLMKKCWDKKPENRPSAINICEILTEWLNNENILLELTRSDELLKDIKGIKSTNIQIFSDNIYKSKFIESAYIQISSDNLYISKDIEVIVIVLIKN